MIYIFLLIAQHSLKMENYYDLLGIERDHPQEHIPHAFRIKIKQVHPDKLSHND